VAKPIFLDPTGRRGRWTGRSLAALILFVLAATAVLAFTIVEVPIPAPLPLRMEQARLHGLVDRIAGAGGRAARAVFGRRWLPPSPKHGATGRQVVSGFYVPWDEASHASLAAHVDELDWVIPAAAFLTGPEHRLDVEPDPVFDAIIAGAQRRPLVLPMVQNARNDHWDGPGLAAILRDPAASAHLLDQLEAMVAARHGAGIVFDFEEIPATAQRDYLRFLGEANRRFDARGWTVSMAAPVGDPDWNLAAYAHVADKIFLMLYDEHWGNGDPGPIASQGWYVRRLQEAVRAVGADKAVATIANYGYNWSPGQPAEALTVEEAWLTARESEAMPRFDPVSGNAAFDYEENDGSTHHVWFLDAASAWNELRAAHIEGVAGVSLWRLGSEDPGIWADFAGFGQGQLPDLSALTSPGPADVEGSGEILRIEATPTEGARTIAADRLGLIRGEQYRALPSPYVVRRTGYRPGLVSLTFDDGPDPDWTPRILDVLRDKHVPATFFVVGENALAHPGLLNRIVDEGHELGNHSYTHPNFSTLSDGEARLEMNATERLVEAYTGRGMRLFRAPYFGDAEPTTGDELQPALVAQQSGYLNVGLHVDSEDWQQPGVDAIVANAVNAVLAGNADRSGQIVLLHDGGGDRAQTLAALPRIIDALRARGFRFVPTAELAGLTDTQVMPRIEGSDLLAVRADVAIFMLLAGISVLLSALFAIAIALGIARSLSLTVLALRNRPPEPPPAAPDALISVLIPAYEEARVIEASVRRVLASRDAMLEVIVIDDGSSDATSAIVAAAFAGEERVKLLTLANGGKARALNQGLALATGAIVVALDADTQFEPETIARLARWFADPGIGAVAGSAKVGNRVNLVTRWQAIEYVTAQNLERRALAGLGAIMVVPGAVGAWRRAALDQVGGFPVDTLAEDQDLTIAVQRAGWRVANDPDAIAWTEAPQGFRALARQRFRWSFGTLQCLWKHRRALREGRPRGLAWIGIPQAWLFQILFALVSPMIDLALVFSLFMTWGRVQQHGWAQTHTDLGWMAGFWLLFVSVDLLCGWIAFRLDGKERRFPAFLLIAQRFVYRQLMYWVVIKAVSAALRGHWVGWGKIERTGRATAPATA
jgi:cellulose synthase/poly-beta-1,6-N-acetylglucosamine synthase-like glycosyltransferase/peptidoglycan/xylan/chitin deacetylase (PgdA/CDA1 family)/spore germination protein YaaH